MSESDSDNWRLVRIYEDRIKRFRDLEKHINEVLAGIAMIDVETQAYYALEDMLGLVADGIYDNRLGWADEWARNLLFTVRNLDIDGGQRKEAVVRINGLLKALEKALRIRNR